MQPLAPAPPVMDMNEEEPPNKKSRQEDHLIPEDVFMQHHQVRTDPMKSKYDYSWQIYIFRALLRSKFKFQMFLTSPNGS